MSERVNLREVPTEFGLDVQPVAGGYLVAVAGDVDLHTAPELRETLSSLVDSGSGRVVVDLSQVAFLDSMGLGVLAGAVRRARERSVGVGLVVSTPEVRRIFEITTLDEHFDMYESRAAALAR